MILKIQQPVRDIFAALAIIGVIACIPIALHNGKIEWILYSLGDGAVVFSILSESYAVDYPPSKSKKRSKK